MTKQQSQELIAELVEVLDLLKHKPKRSQTYIRKDKSEMITLNDRCAEVLQKAKSHLKQQEQE